MNTITTPESAENITDSCITLTQIRLCQHVCMTQGNTDIYRYFQRYIYQVVSCSLARNMKQKAGYNLFYRVVWA